MGEFFKNDGCNMAVIQKVETEMDIHFPASYVTFLLQSNGGEGTDDDDRYIYLWRCEDIPQYNKDYAVRKYLPKGIVEFGMDGDYGYFFDCRTSDESQIISCNFGDLDIAEIKREAGSFEEFIKSMIERT